VAKRGGRETMGKGKERAMKIEGKGEQQTAKREDTVGGMTGK